MSSWRTGVFNVLLRCLARKHPDGRTIADFRALAARGDRLFSRLPKGVELVEETLGGIPVRRIRPQHVRRAGALFLIHGGGWCVETPNLHTRLAIRLASALGMEAVMPGYRLAPEHPFPAANEDCLSAWHGLLQTGMPASSVVLGGDSAGGALALGLLGQIRDQGLEMPACALLMSPATDLTTSGRSAADNARTDVLFHLSSLFLFRHWYLGETSPTDPLASPYWGDFSGFPPLMFQVSGAEILLDNSRLAAARARRQGVLTELSVWPGMPHDFVLFGFLPEARKGVLELTAFARRILEEGG